MLLKIVLQKKKQQKKKHVVYSPPQKDASLRLVPSICLEGDEDKVSTRWFKPADTLNLLHGYRMLVKVNSKGSVNAAPSDRLNKTSETSQHLTGGVFTKLGGKSASSQVGHCQN